MSVRDLLMSFSNGEVNNSCASQCCNTAITVYDSKKFGSSVSRSLDGNTALIIAGYKTVNGVANAGVGYIFTNVSGTWTQVAELTSSDIASGDSFGWSSAISADGNTALISAYYKTVNGYSAAGAAYIFTNAGGTWSQVAEFTMSDASRYDYFGSAVSLSADGNTALIGSMGRTLNGLYQTGAAYVFTNTSGNWTQVAEITTSNPAQNDHFGSMVVLSADGNTAYITGTSKTISGVTAVYVFTNVSGTWTQVAELTATNPISGDMFGYSVSLSEDNSTLLIGALYKDIGSIYSAGAAYIFTNVSGTWTQVAELTASDATDYDSLGYSVSLSADGLTAMVGTPYKMLDSNNQTGMVYVFANVSGTWTQVAELLACGAVDGYFFGGSLSLSADGNDALIGSLGAYINEDTWYGAVYVFNNYSGNWAQK